MFSTPHPAADAHIIPELAHVISFLVGRCSGSFGTWIKRSTRQPRKWPPAEFDVDDGISGISGATLPVVGDRAFGERHRSDHHDGLERQRSSAGGCIGLRAS